MPRILDVGCGSAKYPGAIGVDTNRETDADVLCHVDRGGLPFRDNSFDQVRAIHVIEHVADVLATMDEFHRVARPGGMVFLVTPHYTDFSSFCDPTHRWHLNSYSFDYLDPSSRNGQRIWCARTRMRERQVRVKLLRVWRMLGFELLVNHAAWFRRFWEYYLCYIIRGKVMEFEFEVLK